MFKKISIIALSVTGIALAGCSNQAKEKTDDKPKTEKVTKKKATTNKKSKTTTNTNQNTNKVVEEKKTNNNNNTKQTNNNSTSSTITSNQTNNSQTTKITNGEEAVTYLFTKLTNVDKTQVSGLFNGSVYDNDGKSTYRVNLYKKGEEQPFSAYNVYADGTYTQVW